MSKISIVIPVRNGINYLHLTIESIMKTTFIFDKMIIVESESDDGVQHYCDYLASRFPDLITVLHTKKEGITKAINKGIALADKDSDILLTQNDVIFPELMVDDWLVRMHQASLNPQVGLVTCLNGGGVSDETYLKGFHWFGTWCLYIPRRTINKIGLLDEDYSPGPGDDVDYTYRVAKTGLFPVVANFAVDHHRLCENYNDMSELCRKGAETFRRKHGIPDMQ